MDEGRGGLLRGLGGLQGGHRARLRGRGVQLLVDELQLGLEIARGLALTCRESFQRGQPLVVKLGQSSRGTGIAHRGRVHAAFVDEIADDARGLFRLNSPCRQRTNARRRRHWRPASRQLLGLLASGWLAKTVIERLADEAGIDPALRLRGRRPNGSADATCST
jgi:hypothetical protein